MIYLISDIHGNLEKIYSIKLQNILSKDDYLVILGDFGFGFEGKSINELSKLINFNILFIDGNHENFPVLNKYPICEKFGGKIGRIKHNIFWLRRGEIYTIENYKILTIGGASSIDKNIQIQQNSWFEEENINKKEIDNILDNLEKHDYKVDYVFTHTCIEDIKNQLVDNDFQCYTTQALTNLFKLYQIKYKHWYFGHFHQDKKIDKKHTVIYNKLIKLGN